MCKHQFILPYAFGNDVLAHDATFLDAIAKANRVLAPQTSDNRRILSLPQRATEAQLRRTLDGHLRQYRHHKPRVLQQGALCLPSADVLALDVAPPLSFNASPSLYSAAQAGR